MDNLHYGFFSELPLKSISPRGWLQRFLELQASGLTGHLEVAGYPFNNPSVSWAPPAGVEQAVGSWASYEQKAYQFDGIVRCGYLGNFPELIEEARRQINYVIERADEDGYLGPAFFKAPAKMGRWPHAIYFRAMMAYQAATGDERIIPAMTRHFLSGTSSHDKLRDVLNIIPMLWIYEQNGDSRLLDLAVKTFEAFQQSPNLQNDWRLLSVDGLLGDEVSHHHGVDACEISKLGALLYRFTGNQKYLKSAVNGFYKMDRDQALLAGVPSSSEHLRGKDPLDSYEICVIGEYAQGLGHLLMATGEVAYADGIERACFNAAPSAVDGKFRALQYFACSNQVLADVHSNHNGFCQGDSRMSYRPRPGTACCTASVNRIMPNFIAQMWMRTGSNGLAAVLYGPCELRTMVGTERQMVHIIEETDYPFRETVHFTIHTAKPIQFDFSLRIPVWCKNPVIELNGEPQPCKPGEFAILNRIFADGDRITVTLPMHLKKRCWPKYGVSVERGPLAFALPIVEDWRVDEGATNASIEFPAWNLYPGSPWNYALALDESSMEDTAKVILGETGFEPWTLANTPIALEVPAYRVPGWDLDRRRSVLYSEYEGAVELGDSLHVEERFGEFVFTPPLPEAKQLVESRDQPLEYIRLVPYGCARLRIAVFPSGDNHSSLKIPQP